MYYRLKQLTLVIADTLLMYIGLYFALVIRYTAFPAENFSQLILPMGKLFFIGAIVSFVAGLYDLSSCRNNWRFYQKIIISAVIWLFVGTFFFYFSRDVSTQPKTILLLTSALGFSLVAIWRYFHNKFLVKNILKTKIVFAGYTTEVKEMIEYLTKNPELGYQVIGIMENGENLELFSREFNQIPHGKNLSELYALNKEHADITVIAPSFSQNQELTRELYAEIFNQTGMVGLAEFYEDIMKRIPPFTFSEGWFLANLEEQKKKMYDRFKILIDYGVALIIGAGFCIIHLPVSLLIKLTSPGPIFFRQSRVGRGGKIFSIYKYRTMKSVNKDGSAELGGPQFAEVNDTRVTSVGKFLRKTRLDEVPQFINILRGEMSIIGPRPERPEFVAELSGRLSFYNLRHLIKPGLTGWAQIQKSYYGTIEENLKKLEYDLYYLKNRGPLLDIAIILRTLRTIVKMMGR